MTLRPMLEMIGLMKLSVRRPIMTLGLMFKMIGLMKLGVIDDR